MTAVPAAAPRRSHVVLFSAAIPGQGGEAAKGHRNEQWPPSWRSRFARRWFEVVDCLRPHARSDTRIDPWYIQNPFPYVQAGRLKADRRRRRAGRVGENMPLCVMHPRMFEMFSWPDTPPNSQRPE